jgi:hypothetical protein
LYLAAKREAWMQEIFNVTDFLLSKGFEDITESDDTETLLHQSVSDVFDFEKMKTVKPRWDFMALFEQKEIRTQVKKMVYYGAAPTHPALATYQFG